MISTIVILPFRNLSPDRQQEYFADGLTEEIILALAKIDGLNVISRTSSFYFKDKNLSIKEIAQQLNVEIVLEGSVRIYEEQVRISAQLIKVSEDVPFWSESWDRMMLNIFELQDEISVLIAENLREHLGHFEIEDHLVDAYSENTSAYDLYLRGKFLFNKWNPESVKKAISYYSEAITLDSNLIDAYLGLSDAHSFLGTTQFEPWEESWKKSIDFTLKAKKLNPKHSGVNYQLGQMAFFTNADYLEAARFNLKVIESRPTFTEAQQFMAFLYMLRGEIEPARTHLQIALAIDPLNHETRFYEAYLHYRNHEYEWAIEILKDLLDANPQNLPALVTICFCFLMINNPEKVIEIVNSESNVVLIPDEQLGLLTLAYIIKNEKVKVDALMQELEAKAYKDSSFQAQNYLFLAYANQGKIDDAFKWLDLALGKKSSILLLGFSDPLSMALRNDMRYKQWHKKIYPPIKILSENKQVKKALLNDSMADRYHQQLLEFISDEMPYLNPQLTLRSLAEQLQISSNQLSWLLNNRIGKNFNEYINIQRLEHFKKIILDPSNAHISLIGLAYESGFNSKTVFNTFFKKQEGRTPSQYFKFIQKGSDS